MPEMSTIMSLQTSLKKELNQMDSLGTDDPQRKVSITSTINNLQSADEAMMQWMRGFEANQEGWPHDSVMSYLSNEKKKIAEVRDLTMQAIEEAKVLLGN